MATPARARLTLTVRAPYQRAKLSGKYHLSSNWRNELEVWCGIASGRSWSQDAGMNVSGIHRGADRPWGPQEHPAHGSPARGR